MLNSFYGFFGIDPSKYTNFQLVADVEKARNLVARHNFESFTIISENMAMINLFKENTVMKNHLLVSSAILDLSKRYFFRFIYAFKNTFLDKITPIYFDTDSALFEVRTDKPIWEELNRVELDGKKLMDYSFLSKKDPYYNEDNMGVTGCLKEDNWKGDSGNFMYEVYILGKKAYCANFYDKNFKSKIKGIPKSFRRDNNTIHFHNAIFKKKPKKINE
jgi:hypothetical protein